MALSNFFHCRSSSQAWRGITVPWRGMLGPTLRPDDLGVLWSSRDCISIEPTSLKSPGDAAADPGARLREPVSCPRRWGLETHISHALLIKTESPGPDWNLQPDVLYCASDTGCVPLGNTWGIMWFARGSWKLQGKHHTSSRSTSFLCW